MRKSGDQIRITAQLIKASDGYHLWSETWDRTLVDVFAIQDEIAEAVVDVLKVELLGEVPHAQVTDPRVFELFLQAKAAHNQFTAEGLEEAVRLLTEALAIDPNYAEGWQYLSTTQINQVGQGHVSEQTGYEVARASAERALALDPQSALGLTNLGWIAMYSDWDLVEAARLIARARELQPGNASVLNTYAVLNGVFGRLESMRSLYEEALTKDPMAVSCPWQSCGRKPGRRIHDVPRRSWLRRFRKSHPAPLRVTALLHGSRFFEGDAEGALAQFEQLGGVDGPWGRSLSLWDLGRDAESDAAIEEMAQLERRTDADRCGVRARDDADKAFEWLGAGVRNAR